MNEDPQIGQERSEQIKDGKGQEQSEHTCSE